MAHVPGLLEGNDTEDPSSLGLGNEICTPAYGKPIAHFSKNVAATRRICRCIMVITVSVTDVRKLKVHVDVDAADDDGRGRYVVEDEGIYRYDARSHQHTYERSNHTYEIILRWCS